MIDILNIPLNRVCPGKYCKETRNANVRMKVQNVPPFQFFAVPCRTLPESLPFSSIIGGDVLELPRCEDIYVQTDPTRGPESVPSHSLTLSHKKSW